MPADELHKILCPRCACEIDVEDRFCRRCGAAMSGDQAAASAAPVAPPGGSPHSRGKILLLLFALFGPLALPVLWRSGRFTRAEKIVYTVLVSIATALVIWILWWAVDRFLDTLRQLRELQQMY